MAGAGRGRRGRQLGEGARPSSSARTCRSPSSTPTRSPCTSLRSSRSVPAPARAVRRDQRAYVDEWQTLVARLAPTLDPDEARVAVTRRSVSSTASADGRVRPPDDIATALLVSMTTNALTAVITRSHDGAVRTDDPDLTAG